MPRVLFVDPATKLDTVHDLNTRARGGMVTSLFRVSDHLADVGFRVEVLSDIKNPGRTNAGVQWVAESKGRYDHLVLNRGIGMGYPEIDAKRRYLWTHDLPHTGFIPEKGIIKAFHRVVFMSRYAERIWRAMFPLIGKSALIPNGVDKDVFKPWPKDQDLLIFASAPNRGLRRLPLIYEAIKARHPDLKMKVFSNLAKLHPNEKGEDASLWYKDCREAGIVTCDPIPQRALARQLGQAAMMIMPSDYPEICSNIILQSLACGTPVVTTGNLGSASEWVNNRNGIVTEWMPHDYMVYQAEIVRRVTDLLYTRKLARMQKRAARTRLFSWREIGNKWTRLMIF